MADLPDRESLSNDSPMSRNISPCDRLEDLERQIRSCYPSWATAYFDQYSRSAEVYPPIHQAIVRDLLVAAKARRIIDAGCGPASMLRTLADLDMDFYGFDLTPEMVVEGRRIMLELG